MFPAFRQQVTRTLSGKRSSPLRHWRRPSPSQRVAAAVEVASEAIVRQLELLSDGSMPSIRSGEGKIHEASF